MCVCVYIPHCYLSDVKHMHTQAKLPFGIDQSVYIHTLFALLYTHTGRSGKVETSAVNDGAFDAFLKQVESMHAQGKASFDAEYNVSLRICGWSAIPTNGGRLILY